MNIKKLSLVLLLMSTLFTPMAYAMDNDKTLFGEKKQNVVKNPFEGVQEKVYKRILEIKDSTLLLNWANLFLEDGEYEKAFFPLQEAEKLEENIEVSLQLSQMYEEGKGVERDEQKAGEYYKKAFYLLEQASEKNDPSAVAALIRLYGKVRKESYKKSLFKETKQFYLKQAQLVGQLANMCEKGINIEKNSKAAMSLYGDQKNLYLQMYHQGHVRFDDVKIFLIHANNEFFRLQKELN